LLQRRPLLPTIPKHPTNSCALTERPSPAGFEETLQPFRVPGTSDVPILRTLNFSSFGYYHHIDVSCGRQKSNASTTTTAGHVWQTKVKKSNSNFYAAIFDSAKKQHMQLCHSIKFDAFWLLLMLSSSILLKAGQFMTVPIHFGLSCPLE